MSASGWLQLALFWALLVLLAIPLGAYMSAVFQQRRTWLDPVIGPLERITYRLCRVVPDREMSWREYAAAVLAFSGAGFAALLAMLRLQHLLPLNPDGAGPMSWHLAFNTAASFVTNTNWQSYSGEVACSHFTQMLGLAVQNFVSAAAGIAVLVALARAIGRRSLETIGNFWVDLNRATLYVLLPLSLAVALLLAAQGVPECFRAAQPMIAVEAAASSTIPLGPVASQVAIKQLGTNGGGFYGANSAHPLENPTPLTNLVESLSILWIAAALCFTFGRMIGDRRQGRALFATMAMLLLPWMLVTAHAEQRGNPALARLGVDLAVGDDQSGGNMEGKEVRFGIANAAIWATATTAASNGSVDCMHDALTPLGSIGPLFLMHLGEVAFGGVGSGLYGLIAFAIVAVFAAGLMVGRTPELFGKKIEAAEMKLAVLTILAPTVVILLFAAAAVVMPSAKVAVANGGPHAFSEILYACTSMGANNGSAFAGLDANRPFYDWIGGAVMIVTRFAPIVFMLAVAGSLARKRPVPEGPGTLPTHSAQFVGWLVAVVVIVGALGFLPALALGPIVEHLLLQGGARF